MTRSIKHICLYAMAAGAFLLPSCGGSETIEPVTEEVLAVEINMESVTIQTGGEITLKAVVIPETAADSAVIWMSADESVATVTDGTVKGIKPGSTTVSARCGNRLGSCQVTVAEAVVEDVILSATNISLTVDETDTLTYEVIPANAGEYSASWSSHDEAIASVSQDGIVRARSVGSTVITLSVNGINAQCYVKIEPVEATSITLSRNELTLEEGDNELLTATVAPSNTTYSDVAWESSDLSVATVIDGRVTGLKAGNAVITASCGELTATCDVTVTAITGVRYAVGDIFMDSEGNRGVVFYITDNGAHGKIFGLEASPSHIAYYSSESIYTGASSTDNGRENTDKIRQTPNYETAYPAFKWVEDTYGSDWYIPAQNEVAEIMRNLYDLQNIAFNESGLWLNSWIGSSTELNSSEYARVDSDYSGGYSITSSLKSEGYQMLAVYEF